MHSRVFAFAFALTAASAIAVEARADGPYPQFAPLDPRLSHAAPAPREKSAVPAALVYTGVGLMIGAVPPLLSAVIRVATPTCHSVCPEEFSTALDRTVTTFFWITAAGIGGTGLVLTIAGASMDSPNDKKPATSLALSPGGATLIGRF